jgi:4-amino-4-deoxy-L-arabinose transferase-like glycosyltransferase
MASITASVRRAAGPGSGLIPRYAPSAPRWVRHVLLLILLCAGVLYCWGMSGSEYNSFYASAAHSMSESWKAFVFGSFSPANTITIDKIPGYLWPQALSARLFGFHAWSLVLPQIIEAVVTLLATYRLVRRWAGEAAAVLAAGFLVLTPALVAVGHTNNEEAAYVMCLALAASATQRAVVSGRLRSLVLAGVWVGLAFQCKMVEAWAVLPVIAVTYLVAAPPKMRRRMLNVLVAGVVTLAVSLSWVVMVALVPANSRPYIDGTTNNNPFSMVFGYNALTRFSSLGIDPASVGAVSQVQGGPNHEADGPARQGNAAPSGGPGVPASSSSAGSIPSSGLLTMFKGAQASQVGWLYPLAAVSIAVLLWQRRRRPRTDPVRAGVIMWTIWIVIFGLCYSAGTIHSYYVVTLAPALAALCGAGMVALWRAFRAGGWRAWALPVTLALTDAWAIYIASGFPTYRAWLMPVIAAAGIVALIALAIARLRPATTHRAVLAACVIGLVAVSVGPAAWDSSVITAGDDMSLAMGTVGPTAPGAGPLAVAGARGAGHPGFPAGGGFGAARASTAGAGGAASGGGLGGMWIADGTLSTQQRDLLGYAEAHRNGARFVLTVTSTLQAAPYILRAGADMLSLGGFSGQAPYPTLTQFKQYVASGQVRYVYLAASGGRGAYGSQDPAQGGEGRSQDSLQSMASQIEAWVPANCSAVPVSDYGGATTSIGSGALYLCSGS